ncbi:MAG: cytochrome c peroxidase [Bacteroidota bacterium]
MKTLLSLCTLLLVTAAFVASPLHDEFDKTRLPAAVSSADFYDATIVTPAKVELGRALFFDKILSGNKNISCATCHHPQFASGDGVALAFGEGPSGLGPDREQGTTKARAVHERVPRNAPALFNLGATEFTTLFHDGRVESDTAGYYEGGFITPAKWKLHKGLDNVLAAQAMFPVTSPTEMAGQKGENPIADARALNNVAGPNGVWELLAGRLQTIPAYVALFDEAYPGAISQPEDITFVMAANAIAAFEAASFKTTESTYDQYLAGNTKLSVEAQAGLELFYGKAQCYTCHGGKFQTDHDFHAIAMPQIGPGKADGYNADYWRATGLKAFPEDYGRGRVTFREEDRYKFRTPSLRNVAETGPWGHSGAYDDLESVVRHHLDPVTSLNSYTLTEDQLLAMEQVIETTADGPRLIDDWLSEKRRDDFLARDSWVQQHPELRQYIADANELDPVSLSNSEVDNLLTFLHTLTDSSTLNLQHLVPLAVPSGLPVEE